MKAVIIEKNPFVQSLLVNTFHRKGYEVVTYSDPTVCPLYSLKSCPCQMKESCPGVIVSDYDMPNVNGVEFIEAIRRKRCKCRNIALMSGHSIPKEMLKRASHLNVKFFAKPFHRNQINDWLNQVEASVPQASQANARPDAPTFSVEDQPSRQ